jgi:hypothetical protein
MLLVVSANLGKAMNTKPVEEVWKAAESYLTTKIARPAQTMKPPMMEKRKSKKAITKAGIITPFSTGLYEP